MGLVDPFVFVCSGPSTPRGMPCSWWPQPHVCLLHPAPACVWPGTPQSFAAFEMLRRQQSSGSVRGRGPNTRGPARRSSSWNARSRLGATSLPAHVRRAGRGGRQGGEGGGGGRG